VAGADHYCQAFDVAVNTNAFGFTCLDSRATNSKRLPVKIILGHQTVTLTLDLAKQLAVATTGVLTDDILNNIAVVIAGASVTFTFANLNTPPEGGTFMEALKAYRYTFTQHAWDSLVVRSDQPNTIVRSTALGFTHPAGVELLEEFVKPYFEMLLPIWKERSYQIAQYLITGLYPAPLANAALRDATLAWLDANADAPAALRRLVQENLAGVERAIAVQERDAR